MANVDWDTSSFDDAIGKLSKSAEDKAKQAVDKVAAEILRLSQFEVPLDTSNLLQSGQIDPGTGLEQIVGYNTVYAAYQHEGVRRDGTHPISHWQGGRKGKYLEDPIRHNIDVFRSFFNGIFN